MVFDLQPEIENEIILLRPLKESDKDELFSIAADPFIWEQHPETERYKPEVFQLYYDSAIQSKGAVIVIDKKTGNIIGCSRYYDYNQEESSIVIGYTFLSRSYWGGTYNQSLKKLMTDHAFRFVRKIYFHIGQKNFRSQKAIQKIGAVLVGEKGTDSLVFALDKEK